MSYKDDLVADLKARGVWDSLTTEQRNFVDRMDDDECRAFMVQSDRVEAEEFWMRKVLSNPSTPEAQAEARTTLNAGIVNLTEVFEGKLVDFTDPKNAKLTTLGKRLAEFYAEAELAGIPLLTAQDGLGTITRQGAMLLHALATRKPS